MTLEEYISEHRKNEEKSDDFVSYLYKLLEKRDVKKRPKFIREQTSRSKRGLK